MTGEPSATSVVHVQYDLATNTAISNTSFLAQIPNEAYLLKWFDDKTFSNTGLTFNTSIPVSSTFEKKKKKKKRKQC